MTEETTAKQGEPQGETVTAVKDAQSSANEQNKPESQDNGDKKPDESSSEGKKPDNEQKKEWYIDVITALRAKNRDALTEKEKLLLENAELKHKLANPSSQPEQKSEPQNLTDDEINRRAAQLADNRIFNEKCDNAYTSGKKEFADFDNAMATLNAVGITGPNANLSFLQAVTELPNSHKILHHLGTNPDEAARINSLPPMKMAIELSKIETSITTPKAKPVSKAPPPITPVNGNGKADVDLADPNVDMKLWIEKRRKEKEARKAN